MAFTYDLSTNAGKVRLLIPDNDSSAYELQDAEIEYFLEQAGSNVKAAAVQACRWLSRKYAQKVSFEADGLRVDHSKRAEVFAARAQELARELAGGMSAPTLSREDGFSDAASTSEYSSRTVYIRV